MTLVEKQIINQYALLFERLSPNIKLNLIEKLVHSLKVSSKHNESDFFSSFGAFVSDQTAEEQILEIKNNRRFKQKSFSL
jgi:hypothetical protein